MTCKAQTEYAKAYIKQKREAGLCRRCTSPAMEGYALCEAHRTYNDSYTRRWYNNNKQVFTKQRVTRKRTVLEHYGLECACCGESEIEFLQIDHIEGGGNQHRKTIGPDVYRWLAKNNFPEGFRTLCANCNWARRFSGVCPHERIK